MARVLPYQVDSLQPLQCIVISHWFLQSLLPLIHLVEKWPLIAAAHLLSYICLFILQNVLNQLLVDSGRLLFSTEWNRDYLVQVCFFVVWTALGIYFYFYWSKIETLGLWRTNLAASEQNSLSSDCRLLVQKTNLSQMKPETWNDCHTLQNAPRWL